MILPLLLPKTIHTPDKPFSPGLVEKLPVTFRNLGQDPIVIMVLAGRQWSWRRWILVVPRIAVLELLRGKIKADKVCKARWPVFEVKLWML